jgi:hypothetical protein
MQAAVEMVLEGRSGVAHRRSACVRLDLAFFSFFAGDASHSDARGLIADLALPRVCIAEDPWLARLREAHASFEPEQRTSFSAERLDTAHLHDLCSPPEGVEVEPLDAELLARARTDVSADLLIDSIFPDGASLLAAGGLGFAARTGARVLAAASTPVVSSRRVEIQINTAPDQRRRGLARAVAAATLLEARKRSLVPGWDTANPASAALAITLGYIPERHYTCLFLAG